MKQSEDGKAKTAVHIAAGMGYADVTKELIVRGADCVAKDCDGLSPYELAVHMQTDQAFKNARGPVTLDEWGQIADALTQATFAYEKQLALEEFAEDGIQKLQAAVRGSISRKAVGEVMQNKEYPFLVVVDCANGLYRVKPTSVLQTITAQGPTQ